MRTVLKLFRLQIDNKYDFFKGGSVKKFIWSVFKSAGIIALACFVLYMFLTQILLLGFKVNVQLVSIVILLTQIVTFFFACGNIISTLYLNKDNELLMSLPTSHNQIFFSKMLVIYISELIINAIITLPFLIIFGIAGGFGLWYFVSLILIIFILPLLPLCLASFFSIPLMFIIMFFKRHLVLTTVAIVAGIALAIFVYVQMLNSFVSIFNLTNSQIETVKQTNASIIEFGNSNFLFIGIAKFMTNFAYIPWVLGYVLVGSILMVVGMFLVKPFYFVMAMSSLENDTTIKRIGKFQKRTPFNSLLIKEALTVFRAPGYVFQYFIWTILMPLIVLLYDNLLIGFVVNQTGSFMIAGAHVLILCVLANLSCVISASAISREGGNFYIIKTSPVNYYVQTLAKLVFNAVLLITAIIITAIVSSFYLPFEVVIFSTLIAVFMSLGHLFYSFDADLKKPMLDWFDASEISKVSKNTTKSIGYGVAMGLFAGLFIISMSTGGSLIVPWLVLLAASIFFCVYKAYILGIRVFYQYDRLEM